MDVFNALVEGWSDGSTAWNGWERPLFDFDQASQLVAVYNQLPWGPPKKAWYDSEKDAFCFLLDGDAEPECYGPMPESSVPGLRFYPVGAGSWTWEKYT